MVEDEQQIVEGLIVRLRSAGYDTLAASDGEEGVASAIQRLPDAIILDVLMPKMDGLTALSRLRDRDETRHIPVVVLSASVQDKRASLDAGARFFLTKPYHPQTMLQVVDSITAQSSDER